MFLLKYPLVLASGSPRRRQLLADAGFAFTIETRPTDELFPADMPVDDVAEFLARQKAAEFARDLGERVILCADTVVILDNQILNKPIDAADAHRMLRSLSGRAHRVRTGVCLLTPAGLSSFTDEATVHFAELTDEEIDYYIRVCKPFDKAGAYGAQDFIGLVAVHRLEGSFYTVMGLPTHRVYQALLPYRA
ncbi:Maf family protein [Fibrivirga algicola]|uniref:dTTP/UTP pyrophosphatase n=1 Tax=Fibrivirga algicola TaxID=2950420 RepID=A0ABX0QJS9_9BACT|nr:Maf family protein [Fibrivirga algicola]ARK11462.1 septum formation inhibitor Maf [Fibrella sp. ES10-3-2-2]NID12680.1 septum formation protein Maf [Fibrivirga algicola]